MAESYLPANPSADQIADARRKTADLIFRNFVKMGVWSDSFTNRQAARLVAHELPQNLLGTADLFIVRSALDTIRTRMANGEPASDGTAWDSIAQLPGADKGDWQQATSDALGEVSAGLESQAERILRNRGVDLGFQDADLERFVTEQMAATRGRMEGLPDAATAAEVVANAAGQGVDPVSSYGGFADFEATGGGPTTAPPGEGMTEADMRSAFSTGELQWNQIREAVANGTANPMVQTGFPNQIEATGAVGPMSPNAVGPMGGSVGAPQRMPYGFGGRMSLLDAAQQISLRTPAEIATMQRRMAAAGYFGDEGTIAGAAYRPGVADDATRAAWTKVIQDAWYGGSSVTKVLATAQTAMEDRRKMLEKGAMVSDPQAFHLLANQIGNNVIGRDLTAAEQIYVRTRVLELERQQRQAQFEGRQSFEVNQEAQIEDWLVKFAPAEAGRHEMFGAAFDIARATGRPLKLATPPSDEQLANYLVMSQRNNWTLDRLLQQIYIDAGEVAADGNS